MVTIDVSSLYTSIPHKDGIDAVQQSLSDTRHLPIPLQTILELVEMTLTMNTFKFNNTHYHQVQGTEKSCPPVNYNLLSGYAS